MLTCNKIVINIHPISNRLCWSHQMLCIFVDKKMGEAHKKLKATDYCARSARAPANHKWRHRKQDRALQSKADQLLLLWAWTWEDSPSSLLKVSSLQLPSSTIPDCSRLLKCTQRLSCCTYMALASHPHRLLKMDSAEVSFIYVIHASGNHVLVVFKHCVGCLFQKKGSFWSVIARVSGWESEMNVYSSWCITVDVSLLLTIIIYHMCCFSKAWLEWVIK